VKPATITDKLNFVPIKLRMLFQETELAIGTGFFYRLANTTHLVTNWHNVTGRHPDTNRPLHSKGGVPDRLTFGVPQRIEKEGREWIAWDWKVLAIALDRQIEKEGVGRYP
jgi:hypothetical protein